MATGILEFSKFKSEFTSQKFISRRTLALKMLGAPERSAL